jgi:hypothetical protein
MSRWVRASAAMIAILGLVALVPRPAVAQDGRISLGTLRTDAKVHAVRIAVDYLSNLGPLFASSEAPKDSNSTGWWLLVRPQAQMLTGNEDAFQGVVVKLTGNVARFHAKELAPKVWVMDYDRTWFAFPISAGLESDGSFHSVNGLVEAGVVPIFRGQFKSQSHYQVGLFLQTGYKFSRSENEVGGSDDESEEGAEDALARFRADGKLDFPVTVANQVTLRMKGTGSGWFDMVNAAWYYRLEAGLGVPLGKDKSFDFTFERGSGAPNFNEGDQFSGNLTIAF